ncbi:hypothetical protein KA107_00600 [Candidatus Pacearchaeota archaeon]|nr:hypothetical protein [Candidatus Pacearchaeota archaeon]
MGMIDGRNQQQQQVYVSYHQSNYVYSENRPEYAGEISLVRHPKTRKYLAYVDNIGILSGSESGSEKRTLGYARSYARRVAKQRKDLAAKVA